MVKLAGLPIRNAVGKGLVEGARRNKAGGGGMAALQQPMMSSFCGQRIGINQK